MVGGSELVMISQNAVFVRTDGRCPNRNDSVRALTSRGYGGLNLFTSMALFAVGPGSAGGREDEAQELADTLRIGFPAQAEEMAADGRQGEIELDGDFLGAGVAQQSAQDGLFRRADAVEPAKGGEDLGVILGRLAQVQHEAV